MVQKSGMSCQLLPGDESRGAPIPNWLNFGGYGMLHMGGGKGEAGEVKWAVKRAKNASEKGIERLQINQNSAAVPRFDSVTCRLSPGDELCSAPQLHQLGVDGCYTVCTAEGGELGGVKPSKVGDHPHHEPHLAVEGKGVRRHHPVSTIFSLPLPGGRHLQDVPPQPRPPAGLLR